MVYNTEEETWIDNLLRIPNRIHAQHQVFCLIFVVIYNIIIRVYFPIRRQHSIHSNPHLDNMHIEDANCCTVMLRDAEYHTFNVHMVGRRILCEHLCRYHTRSVRVYSTGLMPFHSLRNRCKYT